MIIQSMIDDDSYKFSMCQAVISKFPHAWAEYKFINRGNAKFDENFVQKLRYQIADMSQLQFGVSEMLFADERTPLSRPFLEWLFRYRYNPSEVQVQLTSDNNLDITITGPWYRTILWEVKLMAIISELYFQGRSYQKQDVYTRAAAKAAMIRNIGIKVIDFGTRRRHSLGTHRTVIDAMMPNLAGTSNLLMAMENNLPVVGTMAHEWIMAHGAMYGYPDANETALLNWREIYGNKLSVALTDTYTTDVFFRNARGIQFDGLRQDSGDPIAFIDKTLAYYKKHGINPAEKKIVFSDSLDIGKAIEIAKCCKDKIPYMFGIGTNLTNDVPGIKPLNMVIKMTRFSADSKASFVPVVKLSDDPDKHTGDPDEVDRCKKLLSIS